MIACRHGHSTVASFLLEKGAMVDVRDEVWLSNLSILSHREGYLASLRVYVVHSICVHR